MKFQIRGELITLDALLKALGWTMSGAEAKQCIADGMVKVDQQVELRKTRKLRGGETVTFQGQSVTLVADPEFSPS